MSNSHKLGTSMRQLIDHQGCSASQDATGTRCPCMGQGRVKDVSTAHEESCISDPGPNTPCPPELKVPVGVPVNVNLVCQALNILVPSLCATCSRSCDGLQAWLLVRGVCALRGLLPPPRLHLLSLLHLGRQGGVQHIQPGHPTCDRLPLAHRSQPRCAAAAAAAAAADCGLEIISWRCCILCLLLPAPPPAKRTCNHAQP